MSFPIDFSGYKALSFDPSQKTLTDDQKQQLETNIALVRDSLVFFTALANVKGLGGHTGGAYDIVPEILIVDGFMKGGSQVHPVYFDEAGHRVAIQYMMAALNGQKSFDDLLHYREFGHGLYGHPERDEAAGVFFSSGRLGHMWSYVNGVAEADRDKTLVMFGSDGSQQEGDDAEAARYAVARGLNVKLLIDDNDVTIAGHPSDYMPGFSVAETLAGHGLIVDEGEGEDLGVQVSHSAHILRPRPGRRRIVRRLFDSSRSAPTRSSPAGWLAPARRCASDEETGQHGCSTADADAAPRVPGSPGASSSTI